MTQELLCLVIYLFFPVESGRETGNVAQRQSGGLTALDTHQRLVECQSKNPSGVLENV